jgi:hypothetical protein
MKTLLCLVLVAGGLHTGFACAAAGEDRNLDFSVELLSPPHVEIDPGALVTVPVLVANNSTGEKNPLEHVSLPSGWQIITPQGLAPAVPGGSRRVRLLVVRAPASCRPGRYDIDYSLRGSRGDRLSNAAAFSVTVRRVQRFDLSVVGEPGIVIAGDPYEAEVHLVNTGNCRLRVGLSGKAHPAAPLKLSPSEVLLRPSKDASVRLRLETDPGIKGRIDQMIRIEAAAVGAHDSVPSTSRIISFDVVPGVHRDRDVYHTVPTETRFNVAIEEGHSHSQVGFSARGALDEPGSRQVDLLVRGPDMQGLAKYGEQDQYRLRYRGDLLGFTAGDQTYSLSPLTQRSLCGRGAEINLHHGEMGAGCFYMEPHEQGLEIRKFGGFLKCQPDARLSLRANALMVEADTSASGLNRLGQVYSVEAGIMPTRLIDCNLEYGFSSTSGEERTQDYAYRIETHGKPFGGTRYSIERIHASPDYAGYYRNADFTFGTLTLPLPAKLEANVAVHSSTTNPRQDAAGVRRRNLSTGVSGPLAGATRFTLGYGVFRAASLPTAEAADFTERTFRLGLARSTTGFSVQGYAESGQLKGALPGSATSRLERFGVSTYFRPGPHHTYTMRLSRGHTRFTGDPRRQTSAAVSGKWQFRESLGIAVEYVANLKNSLHQHQRDDIFLSLIYTLPGGQRFMVRGYLRAEDDESDRNAALFLTCAFPHRLRVGSKENTGTLKGTVYDRDLAAARPLSGVVLIADGKYAVTGDNGEFVFPTLRPGTHYLNIEQNSIGFDRTTTTGLPLAVEINAGNTTEIDVGVVTACRLAGRVSLFRTDDAHNLKYAAGIRSDPSHGTGGASSNGEGELLTEVEGLTRVPVEVSDGEHRLHQMTDQDGCFSFDNLRPGLWTVKLDSQGLPDRHHHENPEIVIALAPGEEHFVRARVVPDDRPIQIIDTGELRSARK